MTPEQYCQDKAARSGSSFYYSFLFLPEQQRLAAIALYAFCREVDDIVDSNSDSPVKEAKLQWWRSEIEALFRGQAQHPISKALTPVIRQFNLPQEQFEEILDGMEMDLHITRYASFKDLSLYCHRVASVVGLLTAEIFGYKDRKTLKYAHDLGMAFQLTNILRDVYEDARRNRIYLPQDELQQFKVSEADIMERKSSDNFIDLMKFQTQRAQDYYHKAMTELPEQDRFAQRAGLSMARIYQATLNEIVADGYRVLQHRISLTPLRKFWLAWRTLRQEKHRYKKWRRLNPATN